MSTPHNKAENGDIAKLVLMPGDPMRAQFIADNFLKNAKCFNHVRGMLGFTGEYDGRRVSVMGSGMGMPSMGIYSYELFHFYGVKYIIRIGSCGSYLADSKLGDVFLVRESCTDSNFGYNFARLKEDTLPSSDGLNDTLNKSAAKLNAKMRSIKALSTDVFYHAGELERESEKKELNARIGKLGIAAVDMESYALFANAKMAGAEASCLLSVSDLLVGDVSQMTADERQNSFKTMMKIALGASEFLSLE